MRALLIFLLALFCCSPAKAQTGQIISCPLFSTTTFNVGSTSRQLGSPVISNCTFVLPNWAMAYFFVQGIVTCGASSDIRVDVIMGANITYQNFGASFNGQISGSVLTVNSMITGSPFVIYPSSDPNKFPRLYDAFSGSQIPIILVSPPLGYDTGLWIVSQQTSNEPGGAFGGRGTYNLNTSVATPIPAETMWALPYRPISVGTKSNTYEEKACQNGTTVLETFAGSLGSGDQGGPGSPVWVQVEIIAEALGGPPQSASFVTGQLFVVIPSMLQGGAQ